MEQINLFEGLAFWKILICFLGASLGAFYFYYKSSDYSKQQQWGLGTLRFLSIFILLFLLLGPKIRKVTNEYSSPIITLLVDDSESLVKNSKQILLQVKADKKKYTDLGYEVHLRGLAHTYSHVDSIRFTTQQTNLQQILKELNDFYYGLDLAKVILYSDGIENTGVSVLASQYSFKLDAVGLGDTTEKKDVKIVRIERNQNVYKGNSFIAQAVIESNGFAENQKIQVSFYQGNKKIKQKTVVCNTKKTTVSFEHRPQKKGVFRYKIVSKPLIGEVSVTNNTKVFFMEVLEGRDKILLVYNAPHPDVKALRAIFKDRDHFKLDVVSAKESAKITAKKYQLILFHGLPTRSHQVNKLITDTKSNNIPSVYFVTNQTYLPLFNRASQLLSIRANKGKNHVGVYLKDGFDYFEISQEFKNNLTSLPPLATPYGDYKLKNGGKLLLGQQVGNLKTDFPLLAMKYKGNKEGVFVGEGFWKWRLQLLMSNKEVKVFDDFYFNFFQLLANNRSFDRLKAYPTKNEFTTNQKISFKGATYNELYEQIYGQKINLKITNERKETQQYSFISSRSKDGFVLPFQKEGIYSYKCTAVLNGTKFTTRGKYVVRQLDLEQLNSQANFDKLRSLAIRQKGTFRTINTVVKDNKIATKIIHSSSKEKELIDYRWLFFALCFLLAIEWFARKYFGTL